MPCEPAPPCEPTFPLFCDPLPTTQDGRRLIVEDSAFCQKSIETPITPSVISNTTAGTIEWEGGSTGSALQITTSNELKFVDGSASQPYQLPALQAHTPDNVPNVLVMLADGTVKKWDPSSVGNNFIAYWDGSDWRINTLNGLLPSGNGLFFRDTSGNLGVVPNGISGSSLQMVGSNIQFVAAPQNQFPGGHLYGLILSNNGGDPDNDVDISVGECRSSTNTVDLILSATMTKRADAAWAQGTGQGGMDTGSKPTSGTLHVYIISNGSDVDAIFSQSATSPTLPGGYTQYRRIGAVTTDSSANIRRFVQVGDRFLYLTMAKDIVLGNALATGSLYTISVPSGIKVHPILNVSAYAVYWKVYDPDQTFAATQDPWVYNNTSTNYVADSYSYSYGQFHPFGVMTNTNRQIGLDVSANLSGFVCIDTHGYFDARGRLQP
jgi:hypothetical protein